MIIPKPMLGGVKVSEGKLLDATEEPDGSYRSTLHDPASAEKTERSEDIMRRYSETLKTLAK